MGKDNTFKFLALGDSYTKGEAVKEAESFPMVLSQKIEKDLSVVVDTKIIAVTGWRTDELLSAIENEFLKGDLESTNDFVTLLIGVNNQYQNKMFSLFEVDFEALLKKAIELADGDKNKVLVISIPDYAFTPLGNRNAEVSREIDKYNNFAKNTAMLKKVDFLNITDITRCGIINPELVAKDSLHISAKAYQQIAERIYNLKFKKL